MILPNFLICGAQKAGTTALYEYLSQHPDVLMSRPKETWFFDANYDKGLEWFASHFEAYDGESAVGEATARTMFIPEAAPRVAEHLPEAKLIFVLRNPIDRAYSQYHYAIQTGQVQTNCPFHKLIRDEQSEFRKEMIQRGMYARQIGRFAEYFDDDQMKILFHKDLCQNPKKTVAKTYSFLGVSTAFAPNLSGKHNVTRYPSSLQVYYWLLRCWRPLREFADSQIPRISAALRRFARSKLFTTDRPEMREQSRNYLRKIYSDPNAQLEKQIDRKLTHWN